MKNISKKRIGILYFSPTNTTKKICKAIALGMGENEPVDLNLTSPDFRAKLISNPDVVLKNIDRLVVGTPVYLGKMPVQAIECLKALKGNGKKCTVVVVYGNRDYGVAIRNMVELLTGKGFKINAAGAFIGQHTYSDIIPVAIGRPDKTDLEKANQFGSESLNASKYLRPEDIPVQLDMFSRSNIYSSLKPVFSSKECTFCGTCAKHCPLGILCAETGDYINRKAKDLCIGCMACVNNCATKARVAKANFIMELLLNSYLKRHLSNDLNH